MGMTLKFRGINENKQTNKQSKQNHLFHQQKGMKTYLPKKGNIRTYRFCCITQKKKSQPLVRHLSVVEKNLDNVDSSRNIDSSRNEGAILDSFGSGLRIIRSE